MCDFRVIDELLFDAESLPEVLFQSALLEIVPTLEFGPLLEYQFLRKQINHRFWPFDVFASTVTGNSIIAAWDKRRFSENPSTATLQPLSVEVLRCPVDRNDFSDPRWSAFGMRLQTAAETMGVGKRFAQGISAALQEMASNAAEHSQLPESALVGYSLRGDVFAFAVADAGEGLLASLRRCTEFKSLRDSDEALKAAVTNGVSRYGGSSGRGGGFRQLLSSLEFAGCQLRFRSGGFHLEFGSNRRNRSGRVLGQSADFCGFLVSMTLRRSS